MFERPPVVYDRQHAYIYLEKECHIHKDITLYNLALITVDRNRIDDKKTT